MPIRLKCQCGKVLSVRDELAGKAIKCPGCAAAVRVPASPVSAAAATPSPAAKRPTANRPATPPKGELDDLFAEEGFNRHIVNVCPACAVEMKAGAVLCTKCGFNKQTGQRLESHKVAGVDISEGDVALTKAAGDIARDDRLQEQMLKRAGMPWWMLAMVLFCVISAASLAVLTVNAGNQTEGKMSFSPMQRFYQLMTVGFGVFAAGVLLTLIGTAIKQYRGKARKNMKTIVKLVIGTAVTAGLSAGAFAMSQRY